MPHSWAMLSNLGFQNIIMVASASLLTAVLLLSANVGADPTWPARTDDLEEIMYQLRGFRSRAFAKTISPCNNHASGRGRQNAAEFLRVGFHDMSTANTYFGTGGLDGSLQFELQNSENTGPGHNTTLGFLGGFLSAQTSIADLIAAGIYASVRSCGGPVIPVRAGRKDASEAGDPGVPQPQNSISTLVDQFDRMGFSVPEMIQLVACGHTLGGVHSADFPDLVPSGSSPEDVSTFDSTAAEFDNADVIGYLDDKTSNPLIVGPSIRLKRNSDLKVFGADSNVTMMKIAEPAVFQDTCKKILRKMIDIVPNGVNLTDPITPYTVKPVDLHLVLKDDSLTLRGYIRVRTTGVSDGAAISAVKLKYKDREGGRNCGKCLIHLTKYEEGGGFDDAFAFFPVYSVIAMSSGISSFTVDMAFRNGTTLTFDNNGKSYPISDEVIIQKPRSCLNQGSGDLTVTALVRDDRKLLPVSLVIYYLVPRAGAEGNPVPALFNKRIPMAEGDCVGNYTFYSASYTIPGSLSSRARLDVVSGSGNNVVSDAVRDAGELPGTCTGYVGSVRCSGNATGAAESREGLHGVMDFIYPAD